jgi:O-antigen ligase
LAALLALLVGGVAGALAWLIGPLPILALLLGLTLAALTFRRPELGALALIFVSYTRISDVALANGAPLSAAELLGAWLLVVLLLRWQLYGEAPAGWTRPALFLGLYGLVLLGSLLYAHFPQETLAALVEFAKNVLLVLLIVAGLQRSDGGGLRRAVWALLAAGLFLGLLSVYQQFTGDFEQRFFGFSVAEVQNIAGRVSGYRIGGPLGSPNYYAMILIPLVALALDRMLQERDPGLRVAAALTLAVVLLSILFTFSRGGFIALGVVLALLLWRLVRHYRRPGLLLAIILIVMVLLPLAPPSFRQRLATIPTALAESEPSAISEPSIRGRLSEWAASVQMFRDHPLVGVGLANYPVHYLEYSSELGLDGRREERSPHSLFLEVAAESGLLGLAAFGALFFAMAAGLVYAHAAFRRAGRRAEAELVVALTIGLTGYLVASLFLHAAYPRFFWILAAIAFAAPVIAAYRPAPATLSAASSARESMSL